MTSDDPGAPHLDTKTRLAPSSSADCPPSPRSSGPRSSSSRSAAGADLRRSPSSPTPRRLFSGGKASGTCSRRIWPTERRTTPLPTSGPRYWSPSSASRCSASCSFSPRSERAAVSRKVRGGRTWLLILTVLHLPLIAISPFMRDGGRYDLVSAVVQGACLVLAAPSRTTLPVTRWLGDVRDRGPSRCARQRTSS